MNRSIIFGIVLIILTSAVTGSHSLLLSEDTKFSIYGEVVNDYNEGRFEIDEGVTGTFELNIEDPAEANYSIYFTDQDTGKQYECLSYTLSNSNDTVYDVCTIYPDSTGTYTVDLKIDDVLDHAQTFYVENASLSALFWLLLVFGSILLILGLKYIPQLSILSAIFYLSALLDVLFTYRYVVSEDVFIGLIGMFIAMILVAVILILKHFIEE